MARPKAATVQAEEAPVVSSVSAPVEYVYPVQGSFLMNRVLYGPLGSSGPAVVAQRTKLVAQTEDPSAPNYCKPSLIQHWLENGCLGEALGIQDPRVAAAPIRSGSGFSWDQLSVAIDEDAVNALSMLERAKSNGDLSVAQLDSIRTGLLNSEVRFRANMLALLGE